MDWEVRCLNTLLYTPKLDCFPSPPQSFKKRLIKKNFRSDKMNKEEIIKMCLKKYGDKNIRDFTRKLQKETAKAIFKDLKDSPIFKNDMISIGEVRQFITDFYKKEEKWCE